MKRKLLFAIVALMCSVGSWADTDVTSSVSTTWQKANGTTAGTAGPSAAPFVTPSGGSSVAMYEDYNGTNTAGTGILLQQTVSGLTNGTYKVELYANAMHANGVTQSAASYSDARVYVFANGQYKEVTVEEKNTTSVNGEYTINNVSVTDGTLKLGLYKNSAGTNWHTIQIKRLTLLSNPLATNQQALKAASSASPIDATDFIKGSVITNSEASPWTFSGSGRAYNYSVWEVFNQNFELSQTISNLPKGQYVLKVQGFYRAGQGGNTSTAQNVILFGNSTTANVLNILSDSYDSEPETGDWSNVNSTFVPHDLMSGGYAFYTGKKYKNNSLTVTLADNTLKLGLKKTTTIDKDWSLFNNFELQCLGVYISGLAETFTSGSTMEADQWYSFTVPTDGDYTFSATEGIVYSLTDAFASDDFTAASSTTALPAGTVYIKSSVAQTLTISAVTPVVANGEYYLYDATSKRFLTRGNNYGTLASVDKYGTPIIWNNYTKMIEFKDWSGVHMFFDQDNHTACWLYTDGGDNKGDNRLFAFEATDGGYYLRDAAKAVYVKIDGDALRVPTTNAAEATVWTLKSKAEHDAILATYTSENYNNVITAASLEGVTDETFVSWLATNRAAKDYTSHVGTAKFTDGIAARRATTIGAWTWTETRAMNGSADWQKSPAYGADYAEAWNATGSWSQTITGLPEGLYKVTVNGFERRGTNVLTYGWGQDGYSNMVSSYLKANNEQVQFKSWYDEVEFNGSTYNPNSVTEAATAFNNDKYQNEVYTYVGNDGNLTIIIAKPSYVNDSWVLFNNVTLTYYDTEVSSEEATAILTEASTRMEQPMKHSLYAALKAAYDTFNENRTVPNYSALRTAIDNTTTSVTAYANMNTYLTAMQAVVETTNFVDATTLNTMYTQYKDAYDNYKTTGVDVENAVANALTYQIAGSAGTARYTANTAGNLLMPGWTINGSDATATNSGFYVNTWSNENDGEAPAKDFANPFYEIWVENGSLAATKLSSTLAGLTPNKAYTVTANVRVQGSSKVAGSITMTVEGGVPVDVTAGTQIGTTTRYIGNYTATGVTDSEGNLTLTFDVAANSNISWLTFRDINYAESDAAISNDFTALNTAISAKESVLGFDEGEYAPYNNITAIQALAETKQFDKTRYYIPTVITAEVDKINNATWTSNIEEVNAFYDGDFSEAEEDTQTPLDVAPKGWTKNDNMRMMLKNAETYPGLSDASATSAMMSWGGGVTYGNESGYEMPLNANTIYELTFKAASWNNETKGNMTVSILNSTDGMAATNLGKMDKDISGNESNPSGMTEFKVLFATGAAGNYVFNIKSTNNYVLSDIDLRKATSQTLTLPCATKYAAGTYPAVTLDRTFSADKWNTLCVPFAFDKSNFAAVKVLSSVAEVAGDVNMKFTDADDTVDAGTPCLVKAKNTGDGLTVTNVTLNPAAEAGSAEATVGTTTVTYQGTYSSVALTSANSDAWVVSNNNLYNVDSDVTVGAYRAYFIVETSGEVKALSFDFGTATGINTVQGSGFKVQDSKIFNLAGQRMNKVQRGVNIVNGKKVLVK